MFLLKSFINQNNLTCPEYNKLFQALTGAVLVPPSRQYFHIVPVPHPVGEGVFRAV